ncbi:hypothetical protein N657DRAFT_647475 [Parathielavia appendiculata]|uniref:Uncharacterized protein n=1 Tax=Parathielavia appendiculata TaxID=2587402 RepID=A0AAN6TWS7_9PEZI|nr:hypothetical protein N657DRAFT_647475 [Parathielavia appendiculata]
MDDEPDLPIARRTRRSLSQATQSAQQCKQSLCSPQARPTQPPLDVSTPKSRKRRRVRFSDLGPESVGTADGPSATGLTPLMNRASLSSSSRLSRRHSTPTRSNSTGILSLDSQAPPFGGEIRVLPLRQVLDARAKRRIRRNGLSEEMNNIQHQRKRQAEATKAEIERLKTDLAARDDEIARMHDETVILDTERVWNLEQEVATLRRELASRLDVQQVTSSPAYERTRAASDLYSEDFTELDLAGDTHDFGEATRAEFLCSTPTRRTRASASFPTPPATSPEPQLPQTLYRRLPTPHSSMGVQVSLPDPAKRQLEEELELLQLEVNELTANLESYAALTSRLSDKLATFSTQGRCAEPSAEKPDLGARLTTVLQTLSDRTAALAELDASLKTLGFTGSDGFEVIKSLRSGFRSARLELEYLTPGEITLPLTGAGAEVLGLLLAQLRDLAKRTRDADDSIDEYHSIELSLRQQLNARVTAMGDLANRLASAERRSLEKDARIADLEFGIDRLKDAVRTYTRDISELEALIQRMETDLAASKSERDAATTALADKTTALAVMTSAMSSLEGRLSDAFAQSDDLKFQLSSLTTAHAQTLASHTEEKASLTEAHAACLAQRDARLAKLSAEVERVEGLLREAQETVQALKAENVRLVDANDALKEENARGRRTAEEVVAEIRAELERVVRMGERFLGASGSGTGNGVGQAEGGNLGGPIMSGAGVRVEMSLVGGLTGFGRASKRRKYDSGLGFLDEDEVEVGS